VAESPRAVVTPAALKWARESIGFPLEEAARRIDVTPERLERAERGDHLLTLRQAERAARLYERPLVALFVPEPPQEEPPEAQFRRLPGAPPLPWPRQLRALARRVVSRQQAAAELYEVLEETPPWTALDLPYSEDPAELGTRARSALGIALTAQQSWQDRTGYRALREWIGAIEGLGVLVMQDGSLPVDDMRGFAATHPAVPAIIVNTNDDPRARAFTAVHEFGHLLRVQAGEPTGAATEQWCDTFAGAVIAPAAEFVRDFTSFELQTLLERIDALALLYGMTPLAAAVRAARLQVAPQQEIDAVIVEIRRRPHRRSEGGDYYRNKVSWLGPAFIQLVFSALDSQALTYSVASGLLDTKVNNFPMLRECAAQRAVA
jgi:Zn-dependent peptidase ImmA (M78 family)